MIEKLILWIIITIIYVIIRYLFDKTIFENLNNLK